MWWVPDYDYRIAQGFNVHKDLLTTEMRRSGEMWKLDRFEGYPKFSNLNLPHQPGLGRSNRCSDEGIWLYVLMILPVLSFFQGGITGMAWRPPASRRLRATPCLLPLLCGPSASVSVFHT